MKYRVNFVKIINKLDILLGRIIKGKKKEQHGHEFHFS